MNRIVLLALSAALATGCAAEFGDNGPVQQPSENEESQPGAIRTFNGQMQRPAEAIGALADTTTNAESTNLVDFYQSVHETDLELGAKYSRSTK